MSTVNININFRFEININYPAIRYAIEKALIDRVEDKPYDEKTSDVLRNIREVVRNMVFPDLTNEQIIDAVISLLIDDSIRRYGRACRDVIMGISIPDQQAMEHQMATTTLDSLRRTVLVIQSQTTDKTVADEISHKLIAIQRPDRDIYGQRLPPGSWSTKQQWNVYFKSHLVAVEFFKALVIAERVKVDELITSYRRTAGAPLAGNLFERIVNDKITRCLHRFEAIPMIENTGPGTDPDSPLFQCSSTWETEGRWNLEFGTKFIIEVPLSSYLAKRNQLVVPTLSPHCYYIPYSVNHPLFDAFFFHVNSIEAHTIVTLYIVQISISYKHAGSIEGYKYIDKISEKLRMSYDVDIVYVFYMYVCPMQPYNSKELVAWKMPGGWNTQFFETPNYHRGGMYCMPIYLNVSILSK